MAEVNVGAVPQQSWAAPKAAPGSEDPWMVHTPLWHVIIRGFQIFFGFVIVVMAGYLIHGKALDANGFAVVCVSVIDIFPPPPRDATSFSFPVTNTLTSRDCSPGSSAHMRW